MVGAVYVTHNNNRGESVFHSIPFKDASIDWSRTEASIMHFKSNIPLSEGDRVRYVNPTGEDFGGQIYKIKHNTGREYSYDVISYLRLYHSKVTMSFRNMTSSQILRQILKKNPNNLRTSGIKDTRVVYDNLKWEKTSIWDIAQQLCWLEHVAGYEVRCSVDSIGTLNFGYTAQNRTGYSFTSVYDYSEDYDSSELITQAQVLFDGRVIANATASKGIIARWGFVNEIEDCEAESNNQNKSQNSTNNSSIVANKGMRDEKMIQHYNIPEKIVNQSLSIVKKGDTKINNLKRLFEWCKQNIGYSRYSNSIKGALGCLNTRSGNCCDNANLLIAMARSIGIQCRYAHAKLSNGQGHVWGEYLLNGKWFTIDTGTITKYWGSHWNGFGGAKAHYDVLPF